MSVIKWQCYYNNGTAWPDPQPYPCPEFKFAIKGDIDLGGGTGDPYLDQPLSAATENFKIFSAKQPAGI